jgi:hypothetical protein
MNRAIMRRTVAGAILLAVASGLSELVVPTRSVAWAQEKKDEKAADPNAGYTARVRQTQVAPGMPRPMEMTTMIRESPKYGHRADSYQAGRITMSICNNYADGTLLFLHPTTRTYTCRKRSPGSRPAGQMQDPRLALRQARAGVHTKLGRRTIDGVEAEGIEVREDTKGHKANFQIDSVVTQYWSGVETGCPVMVEQTVLGNGGAIRIKAVTDQFRWNVPLDPNEFKARIPRGYTEMKLPKL